MKEDTSSAELIQSHSNENSPIAGQSHAFDIGLAAKYGIQEAILIHHFQHWIRINRRTKKNIRDGKCWTYQTRKEIQAHFPYLTFEEVRYSIEKLIKLGVLISRNFNRSPIDKTLWYAFNDEKMFRVDEDFLNNFYERENSPSKGKIPTPIPDTRNTYTKSNVKKDKHIVSEPAARLTDFFFEKLKEINEKIRKPNISQWQKEMQIILDRDKRTPEELEAVINFIVEQHKNSSKDFTWSMAVQSPKKLAEHFAKIWLEMTKSSQGTSKEKQYLADMEFAAKVKKCCAGRPDIDVGNHYILFIAGHASQQIDFGSKDFKNRCIYELSRRGINIQ